MSKDVLKLALEFVNDIRRGKYKGDAEEISTALEQALEQPVPMTFDEAWASLSWQEWRMKPPQAVFKELHRLTTPPAAPVQPVAMRMPKVGDKVVCIEDESLGTVVYLTAGGSPEIKFDDGSHGTYMLREFAELFGYTTPPAQEFVCSTGLCHYKPAAPVQPVASLKEADVLMIAEAHNIDPRTKGLYGFYIDCISSQPAAQPAPVAWQHIESAPKDGTRILCKNERGLVDICEWTEDRFTSSDDRTFGGHLAYTSWTPLPHSGPTLPAAQRQWVGLTDDDFQLICTNFRVAHGGWVNMLALEIEAKLKELNT
jgi:hypothetical protein